MSISQYIFTFIEGIITFISPCILPMIPIYILYLAGSSNQDGDEGNKKTKLIINALGFVIGFTIVFVLLGATASSLGHFLDDKRDILRKISGIIIIIFGLNFMGVFKIGFLNNEKRINYDVKNFKFFTSILFGIIFGFGWTPCIGMLLGAALSQASNSDTIFQGMFMLFLYSMGLGIPFLITAILFDKIKDTIRKIQKYNRAISIFSGIFLIIAGILILFDYIKYLS